jgi:hypothetical protein
MDNQVEGTSAAILPLHRLQQVIHAFDADNGSSWPKEDIQQLPLAHFDVREIIHIENSTAKGYGNKRKGDCSPSSLVLDVNLTAG